MLKTFILVSLLYLVSCDKLLPPGPPGGSTSSTDSPPTSTLTPTSSSSSTPTTASTTTPKSSPTTKSTPKTSTTSTTTSTTPSSPTTTKSTTTKSTTTTTKPTTSGTTAKPTTAKPSNPVGKWIANYTNSDRTCLVLEAALDVDLYYVVGNTTKNVTVPVPSTATAIGKCDETNLENIQLSFNVPNSLSFNFRKNNNSKKYDLESVVVLLNVTLPGQNDTQLFSLQHGQEEFSTPVSNSYKCMKEQSLKLNASKSGSNYSGVLRISHFQMQAFKNASSTNFDQALDCATNETPDVVPIAVGCALAVLVVIVLIAYLIGRRRSQARGYLSM